MEHSKLDFFSFNC